MNSVYNGRNGGMDNFRDIDSIGDRAMFDPFDYFKILCDRK